MPEYVFLFDCFCLVFLFQVNVLALCICTREAYQSMKERNVDDGHIIHINRCSFIDLFIYNSQITIKHHFLFPKNLTL